MAWNDPSGRPNCLRPFACSTAMSRIRWAQPTISAARARAPAWSAARSISQPRPGAPSVSSPRSTTSAKLTSQGRSPAMASMGSTVMPGRRASSRKRFRPEPPRVATISSSATCASFTKSLRPVTRPPGSPGSVIDLSSIDALSSASASAPMRSPRARAGKCPSRCAALPAVAMSVAATTALCVYGLGKHARPISSRRRATSIMEPPLPPYSAGTRRPGHPSTEISFQSSSEKPRSLATLSAMTAGGHWRRRKSRAVLTRSCWSGVRYRFMLLLVPPHHLSPRLLARDERLGSNGHLSPRLLARDERLGSNGHLSPRLPRSRQAPRPERRPSCAGLGGQTEAAGGHGGAEDLRRAARDGLAETRLIEVLDGAAELRPARLAGERRVEPQHLHAERGHRLPRLVGHHLHERRLVGRGQLLAHHPRDPVEEQPHCLHVGGERGQPPPHAGIARKQRTAALGHVRVLDQLPEHASKHGCLVKASPEAIRVEPAEKLGEALALFTEEVGGGHAHLVEEHLVVVHLTGEAPDRPDVEAQGAVVDHEHAEALMPASGGVGAGEHEAVVRDARVAAPDLVAAQHVLVAAPGRFRLEGEQIGAGLGLAESLPEGRLAATDTRQHLAAERLRAVADDALRRLLASREGTERRAYRGQLLEEHEGIHERAFLPSEGARPRHGQPAALGQRAQEGAGVSARAVPCIHAVHGEALGRVRAQESANLFGEGLLVRAELEVHGERASG